MNLDHHLARMSDRLTPLNAASARLAEATEDGQRLADRLRMLADEVESAIRYGVPIPFQFTVSGHEYSGASFSADEHQFAAWADYTEAEAEDYEHMGSRWSRARADVNGLPLEFAVKRAGEAS